MATEHSPVDEHSTTTVALPDDSPPRNAVIAFYTVAAVVLLFSLRYVFISYFDTSQRAAHSHNIAQSRRTAELADYRRSQREILSGGALPIETAIQNLASGRRDRFALIAPQPSTDQDPIRGWSALQAPPSGEAPDQATGSEAEAAAVEEPPGRVEAAEHAAEEGDLPGEASTAGASPVEAAAAEAAAAEAGPSEAPHAPEGAAAHQAH